MSQQGRFRRPKSGSDTSLLGTRKDDVDPEAVRASVERLSALFGGPEAYFPIDFKGLGRVPKAPALVVSNHSGGTSIPDAWGLGVAWYRHFGAERPLHVLAHDMVFALKSTARPFARLGILRARREVAERALGEWKRDLLVFPGGDLDTWRPWSERYQVRFSGRVGYARTALKTGTPIVPVAHAGAHDTLIVLSDGRRVASRLRFPELFRARIFPVHLSFPFLLGVGPTPHLPPPVTLRYRVAAPIWPDEVVPEGREPSQEAILALDARVRAAMQYELDILRDTAPRVGDRVRSAMRRLQPIRRLLRRGVA